MYVLRTHYARLCMNSHAPVVPFTALFRREKDDVLEEKERRERDAEEAAKTRGRYSLAHLYGTRRAPNPPVMVLDGYNFLNKVRPAALALLRSMGGSRLLGARDTKILCVP